MQTRRYSKDIEEKKGQYEHYNILPLYAVGVKPAIMELPEVYFMKIHLNYKLLLCKDKYGWKLLKQLFTNIIGHVIR